MIAGEAEDCLAYTVIRTPSRVNFLRGGSSPNMRLHLSEREFVRINLLQLMAFERCGELFPLAAISHRGRFLRGAAGLGLPGG